METKSNKILVAFSENLSAQHISNKALFLHKHTLQAGLERAD